MKGSPRVAFITSAAKGLGHATVRCLLAAGYDVCFTYGQSRAEAEALVTEGEQRGRRVFAQSVDLMNREATLAAVDGAMERFGRIDVFVHNFGPYVFERIALAEYDDEQWARMMTGNLENFFWIYRRVISGMRERGFGRIVTMGYDGAEVAAGWRFRAPYAAAKAGLASLTKSIAREERQNGITANMVCPGDVRGDNKGRLISEVKNPDDLLGRPPVGEDVARVIVFLCAEDSGQVNGTVTEVTGGYDILAYDDGKDVLDENCQYRAGDTVHVIPWGTTAHVVDVIQVKNRNLMYVVQNRLQQGQFTAYQLAHPRGE
ncbi:MAG: SDR family oxidoreductase [Alicyclobacillaceae bacterium]|jgi:3-oxoacyl-[acyl-carrier protein] reductase|uniref:SDR family oxidoreductase n=1 Tax=Alicyclobacillus sp. SP_1 TaxID=2942475 RepID=UPI00215765D3|nr:SDR family oxidoreductase [Alicyclobacillus sp. SP_1]MCY0888407.1 SDR family oxidoreductase [Alicyclobacillaceae bacterium]